MTTKEKIIEQALLLFSEYGYEGVSVRDIAGAVGIKESSLYNHFKNKQDIFDTIVEVCFSRVEAYYRAESLPFAAEEDLSVFFTTNSEALSETLLRTFAYFFEDADNVRFRRLLLLSQYQNERRKEVYRKLYRDYPMAIQQQVFKELMDQGIFRREDPAAVARSFYGLIFMLIHTCDSLKEAEPWIRSHVKQFISSYSMGGYDNECSHHLQK